MAAHKTLLLFGGTGFVGRAVIEKYIKNGWRVIVTTRVINEIEAKEKLIIHGFKKNDLEKFINKKLLLFVFNVDLSEKKWIEIKNWLKMFKALRINNSSILQIINLSGETSKSFSAILKSNISALDSILSLVKFLKFKNPKIIFCNLGSTGEKTQGKKLAPYEYAKKIAWEKIQKSSLCDYHFVVNYIKGRGEQTMKLVAPLLWNKLKFSHRWLFGFKVSIIDVDDLADIIFTIIKKKYLHKKKLTEIYITSGELLFGEMVKNLLPINKRVVPKPILPPVLEKIFLKTYSYLIPLLKPKNQISRRLAKFAARALLDQNNQKHFRSFKTTKEILSLTKHPSDFTVLELTPDLIIMDKFRPVVYVVRKKSKAELLRIVNKAIVFSK